MNKQIEELAQHLYFKLLANGRLMYPDTHTGYIVPNRGLKTVYPMVSFSPRAIANYLQYNYFNTGADMASCHFTCHLSPDRKVVVFDIVTIIPNRTEAVMLTIARSETSFFDLDNKTAVLISNKGEIR